MVRPSMRGMRDTIDAMQIGKTGLANDQHFKRRILEREFQATGNPAIASVLHEQQKAKDRQHAAKRYNTKPRSRRPSDGRPRRKDFRSPEGFNACSGAMGRSYASKAAERMEKKQDGFTDVTRHPCSIGISVVPFTDQLTDHLSEGRPRMRRAFSGLSNGFQVTGGFHVSVETAAFLSTIFPEDEWPKEMDPTTRPDELFGYLHWHGVIADPTFSKRSVRNTIIREFPGKKRVCVAKVQPERTNKNGEITHGAQGYLEYAMMEKTEIKLKDAKLKKDAIIGLAMLSATWSKKNRSFSMGKPLAQSGVQIDPRRVMQLEIEERLQHVRKNWDKLDYAQQFIHLWMSGKVSLFRKATPWLKHGHTARDSFLLFLALVRKWSIGKIYEDVDFFDALDASLE